MLLLILFVGLAGHTLAQPDEDTVWQPPQNLSQSGVATDPVFTVGVTGTMHLLWRDAFSGFVYSSGDGRNWGPPQFVRLPFTSPPFTIPQDGRIFEGIHTPFLLADNNNVIHGFWSDINGKLLTSQVAANDFASQAGWTTPIQLGEAATAVQALTDDSGRIHLLYVRPVHSEALPTGIYYRRSDDSGFIWTDPILLYQSDYMRSIPRDQVRLQIDTFGNELVAVWDNPFLDTVYTTRSADAGTTWTESVPIDTRQLEDDPLAPGPANSTLAIVGDDVHIAWRAQHGDENCAIYHQVSKNGGRDWKPRQVVLENVTACPTENLLFVNDNNLLFLLSLVNGEGFMQAWDSSQWSEPQLQEPLVSFTDPTTFRNVDFSCLQTAVTRENDLLALGCGVSQPQDIQEIWAMTRPLGSLEDWVDQFPPTPIWSLPETIANSLTRAKFPQLVADNDGRIHAIWSESDIPSALNTITQPASGIGNAIYYARLEDGIWSSPRSMLTSPIGKTDHPAITTSSDGLLYAVWGNGISGDIYFSRAVAERAISSTEWLDPQRLPAPHSNSSIWPDIMTDEDGIIYVVYASVINEGRGIYLTTSEDKGETWSEPIFVFDGSQANWQIVGQPQITKTNENDLHLLWTKNTQPSDIETTALVYARSLDKGQTWTESEIATEGQIIWHNIVGVGERNLHRAWQLLNDNQVETWHQQSIDNGITWSMPVRVNTFTTEVGPTTLVLDRTGEVHIFQLSGNANNQLLLEEWLWDGNLWQSIEQVTMAEMTLETDSLAAAAVPDGRLAIIYTGLVNDLTTDTLQQQIYYSARLWENADVSLTPLPTLTATPPPTATPLATVEPSPTPESILLPPDPNLSTGLQIGPLNTNSQIGGLIISVIPAIIIIGIVFIISWRILIRSR
ncbi:MAG: hypothetical protein GY796_01550 [Chloroflexi bacterium]|nr:hypothetical protein [Chloroflexota bacterium]